MSAETFKAMERATVALENIVRRRGKRSVEYLAAMREYQSIIGRAMGDEHHEQQNEVSTVSS